MIEQGSLTKADLKAHIQKQSGKEAKMAIEQISERQSMGPKVGPMMKQPRFDCDTEDKYNELKYFRLDVCNVFKPYNVSDIEKTALIKIG